MKSKTLFMLALGLAAFNWPIALIVLAFSGGAALGVSYTQPNVQTTSGITTLSTNAREQLWVKNIVAGVMNRNSFADNMIGGPGSGKAFINYTETGKVDGNTITIPTVASFGGPGTQGETARNGQEEKIKPGDFQLKTGFRWFGAGLTRVAKAETVIGAQWDKIASDLIKARLGKQVNDDMMMALREGATSDNTVYANGKTLATLASADTFSTSLIIKGATRASSLGAKPMTLGKGANGAEIKQYLVFGTHENLQPIDTETAYLQALQYAAERGDTNALFTGDYNNWRGHGIFRDYVTRHDAYGSVGNALQPDAFLGTAIVAKGTSTTVGTIDGGGSATAAALSPLPNWFEFFSLRAYVMPDATTLTRGTGTKYAAIINKSDSKVSIISYTGNTGGTLTGVKRLGSTATGDYLTTIGGITWNSGVWLTAASGSYAGLSEGIIDSGSLIVEINYNGTPIGNTFVLGSMAAVFGFGKTGNGLAGLRTEQVTNNELDITIGAELSYGVTAFKRTDSVPSNYVLMWHARTVDGMPTTT